MNVSFLSFSFFYYFFTTEKEEKNEKKRTSGILLIAFFGFSFFSFPVCVRVCPGCVCLSSGGVQGRDVTGRPVIDLLPQTVARCQHGQAGPGDHSGGSDDGDDDGQGGEIIGRQTEKERKCNE